MEARPEIEGEKQDEDENGQRTGWETKKRVKEEDNREKMGRRTVTGRVGGGWAGSKE